MKALLISANQFSYAIQFSPVPWPIGWSRGHEGMIQQRPSSSLFSRRPLRVVLAWKDMSTLWCCPSSISFAHHSVADPWCPESWFWRGYHGMGHAQSMQVSIFWQLPEEVPVNPQGGWSCSTPSRWSYPPNRRYGEVSSCTWNPGSFFFSVSKQGPRFTAIEEDGSDYTDWTCLQRWWCCTARSCLVWPLLSLPRQSRLIGKPLLKKKKKKTLPTVPFPRVLRWPCAADGMLKSKNQPTPRTAIVLHPQEGVSQWERKLGLATVSLTLINT